MSAPIGAAIAAVAKTANSQYFRCPDFETTRDLEFAGGSEVMPTLRRGSKVLRPDALEPEGRCRKVRCASHLSGSR